MNTLNARRYLMLVRVRDFGVAHRDAFPLSSLGGKMFTAVGAAVNALSQQAATAVTGRGTAQEGVAPKAAARIALRGRLLAISQTARAIALDAPGFGDKFRASLSCTDQQLLSTARSFAQEARPLAKTFTTHEMPSSFLTDLQSEIEAFEQAISTRDAGRSRRVAANIGIGTAMDKGLRAVLRLDAIVPNKLHDDAVAVAVWNTARRVEYPTRAKNETPAPATPATPSPATAEKPAA